MKISRQVGIGSAISKRALSLYVLMAAFQHVTATSGHHCVGTGKQRACQFAQMANEPDKFDYGSGVDRHMWRPLKRHSKRPSESTSNRVRVRPRQGGLSSARFNATVTGDATFGRRRAINYCMQLAEGWWPSPILVDVLVNFSTVGGARVLGSAKPTSSWNIDGSIYPVALAEAVSNQTLNAGSGASSIIEAYDIIMTLNTATNWYEGVDGRPTVMTYDLVTVCLHEIIHGLFMSGGNLGVGTGIDGVSYIGYYINDAIAGRFDSFMVNSAGCNIRGYEEQPLQLGAALTGNNLWFATPMGERIARLHAPRPYVRGSSLYHLSEAAYGAGNGNNDLMTPIIGSSYAQHNIGPVLQAILEIIMDTRSPSAPMCTNIEPPLADNSTVEGGGAGGDNNGATDGFGTDSNDGTNAREEAGFYITLGTIQVSGWILIGAGVGLFVAIFVTVFAVRAIIVTSKRKRTPARIVPRDERIRVVQQGNAGEMV